MKRHLGIVLPLILLATFVAIEFENVQANELLEPSEGQVILPEYVPGRLIVKVSKAEARLLIANPMTDSSVFNKVSTFLGVPVLNYEPMYSGPIRHVTDDIDLAQQYFIVSVPDDVDTNKLAIDLMSMPGIELAAPDTYLSIPDDLAHNIDDGLVNTDNIEQTIPNDPFFPNQWAFNDIYSSKMHFPAAWDITRGSNDVVIAILDTGMDVLHPDLIGKDSLTGFDYVNNDYVPDDDHGHGTAVAGIAAAVTNNGVGIAGACWNCKIMPIKVFDAAGKTTDDDTWAHAGIFWAVNNGADIINMSFGGAVGPAGAMVWQDVINYAHANGVTIVAAAGNNNENLSLPYTNYPAQAEHVIAVGAVNASDTRCDSQSNTCLWFPDPQDPKPVGSGHGAMLDVMAPGSPVWSTNLAGTVFGNGYFAEFTGTSAAAPFVSGLAGLILSVNPNLSPDEVESLITENAKDLGSAGRDNSYGWGRIDAYASVAAAVIPPSCSLPGSEQVTLYEGANQTGRCTTKSLGIYPNATSIGLTDNSVKSIKLGSNARLQLCTNNDLGGTCKWFESNIGDIGSSEVGNNVSSAQIQRKSGQGTCNDPGPGKVSLFDRTWHDDQGLCVVKPHGDYSDPGAMGMPDNSVRSVKIGPDVQLQLCDGSGFNGTCITITSDTGDLSGTAVGYGASSARVMYRAQQPDLRPYTPNGWEYPVVPNSAQQPTQATTNLYAGPNVLTFFDWAFTNGGNGTANGEFHVELRIDDTWFVRYPFSNKGSGDGYAWMNWGFAVLTPGQHVLKIVVDPDNRIAESNESNNEWQQTFWWQPITGWYAEFFNNENLSGLPELIRDDPAIDFDWPGSPATNISPDGFSVRWTRVVNFDEDTYHFSGIRDDGARVKIDDTINYAGWEHPATVPFEFDRWLPFGPHPIVYEMYEHEGNSRAKLSWMPTRLPTPTLYEINNDDGDGDYTVSWWSSWPTIDLYHLKEMYNGGIDRLAYVGPFTSWSFTNKEPGTWCYFVYSYRVGITSDNSPVKCTTVMPPPPPAIHLSPTGTGQVGIGTAAKSFSGADILAYIKDTNTWDVLYDGSYVKTPKNIDAFAFDGDSILISFAANQAVVGQGTFTGQDIARFTPSSLGYNNTAGSFAWVFDGSDVGLTTSAENIDALWIDDIGRFYLSTTGSGSVPVDSAVPAGAKIAFQDEDILRFTPSTLGATTAGMWELYWDPTKVTGMGVEDIGGYWEDAATGDRYVTIVGAFTVGNTLYGGKFAGNQKTILRFAPNAAAPGGWAPAEKVTWLATGATFPSNLDGIEMGR